MKCRRSKLSRGARLRGSVAGAAPLRSTTEPRHLAKTPEAPSAELRIDGPTEGSIHYAGTVVVGPTGAVTGEIRARTIVVEGEISGDLYAEETLRISASARITGHVQAPRVALTRGAQLRGKITMRRESGQETALDGIAADQVLSREG